MPRANAELNLARQHTALHIPGELVFIQPGVLEMSMIICPSKLSVTSIDHDHVNATFKINTLQETTFC